MNTRNNELLLRAMLLEWGLRFTNRNANPPALSALIKAKNDYERQFGIEAHDKLVKEVALECLRLEVNMGVEKVLLVCEKCGCTINDPDT